MTRRVRDPYGAQRPQRWCELLLKASRSPRRRSTDDFSIWSKRMSFSQVLTRSFLISLCLTGCGGPDRQMIDGAGSDEAMKTQQDLYLEASSRPAGALVPRKVNGELQLWVFACGSDHVIRRSVVPAPSTSLPLCDGLSSRTASPATPRRRSEGGEVVLRTTAPSLLSRHRQSFDRGVVHEQGDWHARDTGETSTGELFGVTYGQYSTNQFSLGRQPHSYLLLTRSSWLNAPAARAARHAWTGRDP